MLRADAPDGAAESHEEIGMRWWTEFYSERRGILARYGVEAALPAAAVLLGRRALLAEYPPTSRRRPLSLFERAGGVGGQDAGGWVLYRIVKDEGRGAPGAAPAPQEPGGEQPHMADQLARRDALGKARGVSPAIPG